MAKWGSIDHDLEVLHEKLKFLANNVHGGKEAVGNKGGPVKKALMAGAKPIFDHMKAGAPIGKPKRARISKATGKTIPARPGGLLRDSIRRERMRKPDLLDADEGVLVRPNPKKAPHFHLVEFGTQKMAANPFMRRAFLARRDLAYEIIKDKLASEIKSISKKLSMIK